MTDETAPIADGHDPMQSAIAGGYKEEPAPSLGERITALVAAMEHAMAHNAPVTIAMLAEMKDLLGIKEAPAEAPQGEQTAA